MLRLSLLLLLILPLSFGGASRVFRAEAGTLDQSQTVDNASVGCCNNGIYTEDAQTFVTGLTGNLDEVAVKLGGGGQFAGNNINVAVSATTGGLPSGAFLGSAILPAASVPVLPNFVFVFFSPPIPVVAGSTYAIVLSQGTQYSWNGNSNNSYANGAAMGFNSFSFAWDPFGSLADFAFQTFVTVADCSGGPPYRNLGGTWSAIPGSTHQLASDTNGVGTAVWALGTNNVSGGCGIYQYVGGATVWASVPGGATSIAIDNTGQPWAIQAGYGGTIYHRQGGVWSQVSGAALEIAAGAGGQVFAVGITPASGGHLLYQYVGGTWQQIPGAAEHIAVGADGALWAIQDNGDIYRFLGGGWTLIPGKARQIGTGYDGSVYAIGTNAVPGGFAIYKYVGGASVWQSIPGGAFQVVGGGLNELWAHQ